MKTKLRRLALTAVLLSGTSMAFADQGASSAVGDLPGYGEEAYFHEEGAYAEQNYVAPASHADRSAGYGSSQSPHYSQVGVSELQPASHHVGGCGTSCGGCDYACGGGCDTGCNVGCDMGCDLGGCGSSCGSSCGPTGRMKIGRIFDKCDPDTWAQMEFLMWFTQDRDMPALVTTSQEGSLPVLPPAQGPNPNNVVVAFGDGVAGELSAGFRGDYGKWVSDNVGIGGRFWILAKNNDSFFGSGTGVGNSIGRPFLNVDFGGEDAILVNRNGGAGETFAGSVGADNTIDVMGAEAYSRIRFSCAKNCRLDFIGGYTHFDVDDTLQIASESINIANPATGRTRTFRDFFEVENDFNGGQLGFEMTMTRGCWMIRSLTKVHLGNMNQRYRVAGSSSDFTPGGPPATITNGGMLAQGFASGDRERDVFAFAPEANFKVAYRFRKNVLLSVGYSFIYWDNVALTGDIVDRVITDGAFFAGPGQSIPRPQFVFDDSSFWVQGIDLGVVVDF